ncbi:MAG TPA: ATP synthase F1 subunit gamma [Thermoanaerobaculia bacterium]|nr:ATP synthase F1 subunit gamma [Thermoanaerobaculia bacterium]
MANRRILVKRRKATRNIRKITRTMQLVATARFQAAFNRVAAARPYNQKLSEMVAELSRALAGDSESSHPLMAPQSDAQRGALVVITSNRGLCGAYNTNVLRAATAFLDAQKARGLATDVHMMGKKGVAYFRFGKREMVEENIAIGDTPRFEEVERVANGLMARFLAGEITSVHVASMRFLSAGQQKAEVFQLLPLATPASAEEKDTHVEYELLPDAQSLLAELLPATVRVRLFQAFQEAAVSEQVLRMVAMKAATDAAEDMIKRLTMQYNRARQTAITMELLDIVGGANALA